MTTAFSYAVRGRFVQAFRSQPAGLVFALAAATTGLAAAWTLFVGHWPAWMGALAGDYRTYAAVLAVLLLGWLLKIGLGLLNGSLPAR